MLGSIDRYKKPEQSRLFLCKPNRKTIAELSEAYGKELKTSYNGIHELSFTIPYKVIRRKKIIVNPHFHLIKGDYLIKYVKGNIEEYFVIDKPSNNGADTQSKTVQCYLQPYSLRKKLIRNYKGTKKLYDPIGTDGFLNDTLLKKTNWSIGYVDADLSTKYRTVDIPEQSLIEFIQTLNEAFGCIPVWDTKNKRVSFYKENDYGTDKGLYIEEGKYLKSISEEPDFDSVATRIYVYGKEGLTFNSVNSVGTDYIESFDFYLYPFERDVNRNIIKHSNYMSDELCHSLLDYADLIQSKEGAFASLLSDKETLQSTLVTKNNELTNLEIELAIIQDQIDVKLRLGEDTTLLQADKTNKETEITNKKAEIALVESDIANIDSQIEAIKTEISLENNFTTSEIIELNDYVHEKIINHQYIDNEKELYEFAKTEIVKISQPLIHYKVDLVDFTKVVQCQRDWDKLSYGDIITIRYPKFNIEIKAKIISISHQEDNNSISIEIANSADINSGFLTLKDLYQKTTTSASTIDMSKFKWDMSEHNKNSIDNIINNTWDANERRIVAGVNESVQFGRRGMIIQNPDFPNELLIAQSGILGVSNDGGTTFKNAITSNGLVGERVFGKIIAGVNLAIENESGKYTMDDNGFTIDGGSLTIRKGDNGVSLNTTSGLVVTRSDEKVRSTFNATDGIKVEINKSGIWQNSFYFDANLSRLVVNGEIDANELKVNGVSVLTVDKSKISGNFIDQITTNQLVAGTAKITSAMIESLEADKIRGNIFTVGTGVTSTKLEMTTSDNDVHVIKSTQAGGFHIQSTGSLALVAGSSYGIYTRGAPLVAENGFRASGTSQFNNGLTVSGSLYATDIYKNGSSVLTLSEGNSYYVLSGNGVEWYNTYNIRRGGATLKFLYGSATLQARNFWDDSYGTFEGLAYSNVSKREEKKDIELFTGDALTMIASTAVYSYRYNSDLDTEPKRVGIIYDEAPMEIMQFTGGIDVYGMTSLNWKATQMLIEKINISDQKITDLEARVAQLEANDGTTI